MSWFQPHSDNDLEIMWKWYNRNLKTKCKSAIKSLWDQRKAGFFAKLEVPLQVSHNYFFFLLYPVITTIPSWQLIGSPRETKLSRTYLVYDV